MIGLWRARLAVKYMFFEMLPSFLLGVIVFVFILLMFQALRLTEFILVHGVDLQTVGKIMGYLSISFLPVILPMSLLFSILLTYGRLSSDSEIVAFRSLGLNFSHIAFPALLLSIFTGLISAETSFFLGPWGNRQFEVLITKIGSVKASASIKEGVFSEGFFDLVVYANKVNSKTGLLEEVFIYDERNPKTPVTIIARQGYVSRSPETNNRALLKLIDGNMHQTTGETYTKINFESYEINLLEETENSPKKKSPLSMNLTELREAIKSKKNDKKMQIKLETELHKRWAISFACPLFALIGVAYGISTNRRSGKSSGLIVSLVMIVTYWILYIVCESLAKNQTLQPIIAVWLTNLLFTVFGIWSIFRFRNS